ncbi:unnamed protein product [Penicillium olsonii]|nr:unnamed protein product [Penicillium olsonii]CAG7929377.1 unnamed protein product [Penicillium olsonii]
MDACSAVTFPSDSFTRLLDVNVVGTFRVVQRFGNNLQSNPASVVLVSSMSGHVSYKGLDTMAYNASKAALHQMTRSLAAEWGARVNVPLIRVNSLSPGCIRTPASAEVLQGTGLEEMLINDSMLYRLSTADEYRAPVIFLLGDGSSYMTGSDLRVDGGHCAW